LGHIALRCVVVFWLSLTNSTTCKITPILQLRTQQCDRQLATHEFWLWVCVCSVASDYAHVQDVLLQSGAQSGALCMVAGKSLRGLAFGLQASSW
jgi:hypothetical protein